MNTEYPADVTAAKAGDLQAFRRLVEAFQDQVTGAAFSWLGDIESARDVAQEAFIEAHLCLHQLAEPAAFPGWLRRIVIKRCDRVTRRQQLVSSESSVPDTATSESDPAHLVQLDQQAEQLRLSISALPDQQRMVIALQYFADISGEEISRFLELPLTTVKKRLHEARRKLREQGEQLMQKSIDHMKPSSTPRFSEETTFFIALRERNLAEVKRILEMSPSLVNAEQNWSPDLAHQRVLPFPNRATALITAVELDDIDLLDLLLAAGADPDGRCGCATGESAVWTAALFNRPRHLKRLLDHTANPNVISAAGNTPLHVAAMRGYADIVRMLLAHGANPNMTDSPVSGNPPLISAAVQAAPRRTAADWARVNGFDAIANEIEGQVESPCERFNCAIAIGYHDQMIETGIRAIDFFAPIEKRSLVRFPFAAGVGMLVLLGEMSLRFAAAKDTAVVWTGFTQPPFDKQDFEGEMAEFGLQSTVVGKLASFKDRPEQRRAVFEAGVLAIESLRDQGKHVLAVVLSTQGFQQDVEASFPRLLAKSSTGAVTTIMIAPFKEEPGPWSELRSPFTAQWTLDRRRANKRLYPAIDPQLSMSSVAVSERHARLRSQVVGVLIDDLESEPALDRFDPAQSGLAQDDETVLRLLRHFAQPFSIATPFGGPPGEYSSLDAQLDEVERLVAD